MRPHLHFQLLYDEISNGMRKTHNSNLSQLPVQRKSETYKMRTVRYFGADCPQFSRQSKIWLSEYLVQYTKSNQSPASSWSRQMNQQHIFSLNTFSMTVFVLRHTLRLFSNVSFNLHFMLITRPPPAPPQLKWNPTQLSCPWHHNCIELIIAKADNFDHYHRQPTE